MSIVNSVDFELSEILKYHHKGENKESTRLELSAPANKHWKRLARLEQGFTRSLMSMQKYSSNAGSEKPSDSGNDEKMNASNIMIVLMSGDESFESYVEEVSGLLTAGVCLVNGETKLTQVHLDAMLASDFRKLMGVYLENFILGSLVDLMKK